MSLKQLNEIVHEIVRINKEKAIVTKIKIEAYQKFKVKVGELQELSRLLNEELDRLQKYNEENDLK